jgi:LCP family protein required for cell wall assembly
MSHASIDDFFARQAEEARGPEEERPRKPRRRRRILAIAAVFVVVLVGATAVAGTFVLTSQILGNIRRIPNAFAGLNPATRPTMPAATRNSVTILLAGSDIRSPRPTTGTGAPKTPFVPGEQRSDTLMLIHINANRKHVSFVSIPRDSWVHIPGMGMMKINAALSLGGPPLMIKTVEDLTHVRINHYAVIDFQGFENVVRALGGVDVRVAQTTSTGNVIFHRGINDLNPVKALAYVRQRDGLPGGDLSRIQRQQNLIRAILAKTASWHVWTDPFTLYHLLNAFSRSFSVDSTFTNAEIRSLLLQLRGLRGSDFTFLTAPVRGLGWEDGQSVVFLNRKLCATLWNAIRHDSVAAWAARHSATLTPATPP